jgi:hypothetical protein
MKSFSVAVFLVIAGGFVAQAQAFESNTQRSCQGGSCTVQGSATGSKGGEWSRQGTAQRTSPGNWNYQGAVTGPKGRTHNYQGRASIGR